MFRQCSRHHRSGRLLHTLPLTIGILSFTSLSKEAAMAPLGEGSGDGIRENSSSQITTVFIYDVKDDTTFVPFTNSYDAGTTNYNHDTHNSARFGATTEGESNFKGSLDIVPIVGAVCGVAGILIGIIISALAWFYIAKKRLRQHTTTIPKNPEEKTFERLDFNLTLPRQQVSPNSSASNSSHNFPQESSYLHFEEPTPFANDMYDSAEPHRVTPIDKTSMYQGQADSEFEGNGDLRYAEEDEVQYSYSTTPPGQHLSKPQSNEKGQGLAHTRYTVLPEMKHPSVSCFGAILNNDSSDQSTISKRSSSVAGADERRSSVCTCRTDLPDSDSSNCSTCGGSLSLTSSLAREKPHTAHSGCRDHGHDMISPNTSFIPRDILTFAQIPTSQIPIREACVELSFLSSSDSFIGGHDTSGYRGVIGESESEETNYADSLKYFDLQMPSSTFATPHKPGSPNNDQTHMVNDASLRRHPETFDASNDELIVGKSNSYNTINL